MNPNSLRIGHVYFAVSYQDSNLRFPVINSLVFLGVNLEDKKVRHDRWYFQDTASYVSAGAFPRSRRGAKVEVHRMDKDGLDLIQDADGVIDDLAEWAKRQR